MSHSLVNKLVLITPDYEYDAFKLKRLILDTAPLGADKCAWKRLAFVPLSDSKNFLTSLMAM